MSLKTRRMESTLLKRWLAAVEFVSFIMVSLQKENLQTSPLSSQIEARWTTEIKIIGVISINRAMLVGSPFPVTEINLNRWARVGASNFFLFIALLPCSRDP